VLSGYISLKQQESISNNKIINIVKVVTQATKVYLSNDIDDILYKDMIKCI